MPSQLTPPTSTDRSHSEAVGDLGVLIDEEELSVGIVKHLAPVSKQSA
jgi:hypothetical protein